MAHKTEAKASNVRGKAGEQIGGSNLDQEGQAREQLIAL